MARLELCGGRCPSRSSAGLRNPFVSLAVTSRRSRDASDAYAGSWYRIHTKVKK